MWDTSHITFLPSLLMQIQFVTPVFPCHLEKRNPNFKRFLSYELPFKFSLLFFTKFAVFSSLSNSLLDGVSFTMPSWYLIVMSNMVKYLSFKFFKSFVLSDFSFVFVLHFTGKPNLTNLSKSRKNAQIVYEISHNSNVLSWKHNNLEKLQLWLSLADDHF